jgi:hypothetical protein
MVIIICSFNEGSGKQGEMSSPVTGGVCRIDGGPPIIGLIQHKRI